MNLIFGIEMARNRIMKKLQILVLITFFVFGSAQSKPQITLQEIFGELSNSFKAGNTKEIAKYFAASVDITLPNSEDQYSRSQAEIVLKNFFSGHVPSGFNIEHKGASNNGKYIVGTLITNKGAFKVYVFVKDILSQYLL
ncbi:MAG: DUF4783 domain-containing protein, partial [Ferruginibacter sp.]